MVLQRRLCRRRNRRQAKTTLRSPICRLASPRLRRMRPTHADGKLATEVTSNYVATSTRMSAIAMQRFESLMLKALERAGEQDRIDALHREASRRACL